MSHLFAIMVKSFVETEKNYKISSFCPGYIVYTVFLKGKSCGQLWKLLNFSIYDQWFILYTFLNFSFRLDTGVFDGSLLSTGGSASILWPPRAVVWRKWSRWRQNVHLSWCRWISNRLQRHLCWQSGQLLDPASWLCKRASMEWSDMQRSLFSGTHLIIYNSAPLN